MPELAELPGNVTIQPSVDGAGVTMAAADDVAGTGGSVLVKGGAGVVGGNVTVIGNDGQFGGGQVEVDGGSSTEGYGGSVAVQAGNGTGGGPVTLRTGAAVADSAGDGGDLTVILGAGDGVGRGGQLFLYLPTSDPHVDGAAYWNSGVLTKSAG